MSDKRLFIKSSLGYALSQIIGFSVSLVSFPLLTRILSAAEYGVLGLCSTSLLLGCAFSKLGIQNSIVRYYYEYRRRDELGIFYSTLWWGGGGTAAIISLLFVPIILLFAPPNCRFAFISVAMVVFATSLFSIVSNFLRAEERNATNALVNVIFKVVSTFSGLAVLYYWNTGISGIFLAQFLVLGLITAKYAAEYFSRYSIRTRLFSRQLFREALSFGTPLIAFEVSSIGLAFSDRYLITYYCGAEQLGIYTAGYTLCFYIADTLKQPLGASVVPIYLRLYTEQGVGATIAFMREIIGYVFLVICPVFAGVCAVKDDLLVLLASQKYSSAAIIIPWVLGSTLLYACQPVLAAGFTIKKQTRISATIIVVGALLNVLLNIILLPRYGIIAAAWSTAVAYLGVLFVMTVVSMRTFPIELPYRRVLFYVLSSLVMYFVVSLSGMESLLLKVAYGMFAYSTIILVFDRKVSSEAKSILFNRFIPRQADTK